MKKIRLSIVLLSVSSLIFAQAPDKFSYQGVARDALGNELINQNISLRFSIVDVSPAGTVLYSEEHNLSTNALGLFNVQIGGGIVVSGVFANINWGTNAKYLKVEIDPAGGSSFINLGSEELLSVPFALHAKNSSGGIGATGPRGATGPGGGPKGATGTTGLQGPPGSGGLACWDLNQNGICDLIQEDVNLDAACDALDCRGPQGPDGPTGPAGAVGAVGGLGPAGPPGPTGAIGTQGPTGPGVGAPGATGPQGSAGPAGAQGPQGVQGNVGPPGAKGATGSQGNNGAMGTTGAVGPKGNNGAKGTTGAVGPKGNNGAPGAIGPKGATGDQAPWIENGNDVYVTNHQIGIGTSSPTSPLQITANGTQVVNIEPAVALNSSADALQIRVASGSSGTSQFIEADSAGHNKFIVDVSGRTTINNDLRVKGEINYTGSSASLTPICYGIVSSNGARVSNGSMANFSVSYHLGMGYYEITITGENFSIGNYCAMATAISSGGRVAVISSGAGKMIVRIYNMTTNNTTKAQFNFIVYKP